MRYLLSCLMIVSVGFFGFQLIAPVGAVTSSVSGEMKLKISGTQMKKSLLQRKIRILRSEIAKTTLSIKLVEKKISELKQKKRPTNTQEARLEKLKEKKAKQKENLSKLEIELTQLK